MASDEYVLDSQVNATKKCDSLPLEKRLAVEMKRTKPPHVGTIKLHIAI